jgi:NADPH:quinone reductase-like Zn-dependent oxidoreductase
MQDIPKRMKAITQDAAGEILRITEIETPIPKDGEVLVRMEYASINPSDLSLLQGTFKNKPNYPITPGIEGSGTVVKAGKGLISKLRMGKRVSCTSTEGLGGSWAEYMLTSAMHVVPINKEIDFKQATSLIVNPLTAIAFIDIAKKKKVKSILNNAAAGALGKMLVSLAKNEDISLINIVRNQKQKNDLESIGANNVLNSLDDDYLQNLELLIKKLNTTIYFDAIGGSCTDNFINFSPESSTVYLYANLSEEKAIFNPRTLLQQNKTIEGFFLGNYSSNQSLFKTLGSIKKVQKLIHTDLKTEINEIFNIDDVNKAIKLYSDNMSRGKVLLRLNKG